jgi:RNA polymerase II subunit A small phosphatase-like protein
MNAGGGVMPNPNIPRCRTATRRPLHFHLLNLSSLPHAPSKDSTSLAMEANLHLSVAQEKRLGAFFSPTVMDRAAPTESCGRKKKRRHSKDRKKEKATDDTAVAENDEYTKDAVEIATRPGKKKMRKLRYLQRQLSPVGFLFKIGEACEFTGSVKMPSPQSPSPKDDATPDTVRIITSCMPLEELSCDTSLSKVQVQPLLVLDLNGILCHRFRPPSPYEQAAYRPEVAVIARTPIIPRIDLEDFLHFLNLHFCLAVWTSAKQKTADQLVKALIPPTINLLFVWAQQHCDIAKDSRGTIVFEKNLEKVWKQYPLWNVQSTLLIDDCPSKCRRWRGNALHPPALLGLRQEFVQEYNSTNATIGCTSIRNDEPLSALLSDHENAAQQRRFFEGLVAHWRRESVTTLVNNDSHNSSTSSTATERPFLRSFLQQHAVGHMGWLGLAARE